MAEFPPFAFTTQEDWYGELTFRSADDESAVSLSGRQFVMLITPAQSGASLVEPVYVLTMAQGGGLSLKEGDPSTLLFRISREITRGFARGTYTGDVLEVVGDSRYLFMPVRIDYAEPSALRAYLSRFLGVKVSFASRQQPIYTPLAIPGRQGAPGATIINGTVAPVPAIGRDGDFFIEDRGAGRGRRMYGPKAGGAWPGTPWNIQVAAISDVPGLPKAIEDSAQRAANLGDLTDKAAARGNIGLGSVDNTADAAKPVSIAQGMAIATRLAAISNLSDLSDKGAGRQNLGLGDIATMSRSELPRVRLTDLARGMGQTLVGDSTTLEGPALQATLAYAAANKIRATGAGYVFASAGTVRFYPGLDVEDLWITASSTNLGAGGRLLFGTDMGTTGSVRMRRVLVRVTGDASLGSVGESMGFHLNGGANHYLEDIDASVVGKRTLIALTNMRDSEFIRLYAHDGLYNDPAVTDDCVQGIWLYGTTGCRLTSPRVADLFGNGALRSGMGLPSGVASTAGSSLWTRGIACGANRDLTITDPHVSRVDQGIDVSGSAGNVNVKIGGGAIRDVESHGIKFANSAYRCSAIGTSVERAGRCAVVASGPAGPNDDPATPFTQDCLIAFVTAIDTGTRRSVAGTDTASFYSPTPPQANAFRVEQSGYAPGVSYPRGIVFDNCHSIDRQATPRTRRGFLNDTPYTRASGQPNVVTGSCTSVGHTEAFAVGFHEPKVELQALASGTINLASGVTDSVNFAVEIADSMDLHSTSSNVDIVFIEPGIWRAEATVVWPGNATGARSIQFGLNGNLLPATLARTAGQGTDHQQQSAARIVATGSSSSNFRMLLSQTSGGALALDGTRVTLRLVRER